ncbi:hypothetical protein [Echinicola salinicaeni]|uniref:hypothetical protein n=1 Tax=Echinicola salinicaeni TaxID=2762757 RepID=UPI0016469DAE|nr:hypothetical protein [Echinicola salinicaeni]
MKTLVLLFLLGTLLCVFTACETALDESLDNGNQESELYLQSRSSTKELAVPFKARMQTSQADDALSELCSFTSPADFWGLEHQVGGGNATHMGNYTIDLKFCFHVVLNEEGLPDSESGFGEFGGGDAVIEANNGDLLYSYFDEGVLVPVQDENYDYEFVTIFHITGGTGRFENASGEITNYGYVKADGSGTDHIQKGTIILN